ncbi:MAG TPA: PDZ domain-containing protein [Anaerolineales bacterium]|nr:PDZ domain-containing protein [Anaerolineales bacterium]
MQPATSLTDKPQVQGNFPKIKFGFAWLIIAAGAIWAIVTYYLPVIGGTLTKTETLIAIPIIVILLLASVVAHVLAHLWVAHLTCTKIPFEVELFVFGDAAQSWSEATSVWHETLAAGAGLVFNLLFGGLAYLLWNAQVNDFVGVIVILVGGFNAWMFIVNLIPAFPMDGARLMRVALRGLLPSELVNRLLRYLGFVVCAVLTGWGIFLLSQHSRFSLQTGVITFLLVLLLLDGLRLPSRESISRTRNKFEFLRAAGAVFLFLCLLLSSSILLLTNDGLEAPGVSLPVESMVNVPAQYRHQHSGSFYLVTVISEAPITAGEWVLAQVNPAIRIVPPETVVPQNTTPQQQAKQNYQMLDDSEATAIAVGLRLAGYPGTLVGKGVEVSDILPESHANGILQSGDVITALNGTPIQTTDDLVKQVQAQAPNASVRLQIQRGGSELTVTVPLMPPASSNDSPKIGIAIQSAGLDFNPPFPVSIQTQKIEGGPSAGLIFTLTVYNALSVDDLTGGQKIAGTGTINLDGTVGPIGGVKQKVFAAEAVGAKYFLCPVENYADAVSVAKTIQVVKIATVEEAVSFLHSLPPQ